MHTELGNAWILTMWSETATADVLPGGEQEDRPVLNAVAPLCLDLALETGTYLLLGQVASGNEASYGRIAPERAGEREVGFVPATEAEARRLEEKVRHLELGHPKNCGSHRSDREPRDIKPYHDGTGERESRGICIAIEQGNKMLEKYFEQHQERDQSEASPNELVGRYFRRGYSTGNRAQGGRDDRGCGTPQVDRCVTICVSIVWLSVAHSEPEVRVQARAACRAPSWTRLLAVRPFDSGRLKHSRNAFSPRVEKLTTREPFARRAQPSSKDRLRTAAPTAPAR